MSKVTLHKSDGKYSWSQNADAVTISLNVRNVAKKNIDIVYTDLVLKVNVASIRFICVIDFPHEIDFTNPNNKIQQLDESIEVFLIKQVPQMWTEIQLSSLSNDQLTQRRNESLKRYYEYQNQEFKKTADLTYKHDSIAVNKQMKVETHQREFIENKKKEIHLQESRELTKDLKRMEQQHKQLSAAQKEMDKLDSKEDGGKRLNQVIKGGIFDETDEEIEEIQTHGVQESSRKSEPIDEVQQSTPVESIDETQQEPEVEMPAVRQNAQKQQEIKFTEKTFAHLPQRESQLREPPYPKSKKLDQKKNDTFVDIEDKDPVWLKDKGDHYFKRHDYNAAIAAYSKALENDKEFLMGRLNRATAFIKVRSFNLCIDDIKDIMDQIDAIKPEEIESDKEFYDKIIARSLVKRGAAYAWTSRFDLAIADFQRILDTPEYCAILGELDVASLRKDLAAIKNRQKSQEVKQQGDECFFRAKFDDALEKYEQALEHDQENEYAIANCGVIALKQLDYLKCIEYSTRALERLESFMSDTKSFQKNNILEVKLLLRRAKSYEMTSEFEKAKDDLDKTLLLEPQNGEARQLLKKIQQKLDEIIFTKYRDQANESLKTRKFQTALELYEKALKVTRKTSTLDNIAVYVNKIACLLSLDKLDRVVAESNDAIRLIKNFKNRVSNMSAEQKERLKQMDLRVAVRRGNALGKLQRIGEAIKEYERALVIDPENASVAKDLERLRKAK